MVRKKLLSGLVAQLGERLNGIQEVRGSIPLRSTMISALAPVVPVAGFFAVRGP